jgi:hypothetical protein
VTVKLDLHCPVLKISLILVALLCYQVYHNYDKYCKGTHQNHKHTICCKQRWLPSMHEHLQNVCNNTEQIFHPEHTDWIMQNFKNYFPSAWKNSISSYTFPAILIWIINQMGKSLRFPKGVQTLIYIQAARLNLMTVSIVAYIFCWGNLWHSGSSSGRAKTLSFPLVWNKNLMSISFAVTFDKT